MKPPANHAKMLAHALINEMGPMASYDYIDARASALEHNEMDIDGRYRLDEVWEAVRAEVRKWEEGR